MHRSRCQPRTLLGRHTSMWRWCILVVAWLLVSGCTGAGQRREPRPEPAGAGADPTTRSAAPVTHDVRPSPLPQVVPRSTAPRVPYVSGTVLHRPDGSRLQLRLRSRGPWGVTSIIPVPMTGGYLVTDHGWFEGTVGMQRLDPNGQAVDAWASTGPARLGPDGQVAWVRVPVPESMQDGQPALHVDHRVQELPGHIQPSILRFDGARVVYSARVLGDGRPRDRTFETTVPGRPRRTARPTERSLSPRGTHWWVRDDRKLVLGRGEAVLVRLRDRGLGVVLAQPVWEDDRHLLATLVRDRQQALVRVGVDGTVTRATAWVPATTAGHAVLAGRSPTAPADD